MERLRALSWATFLHGRMRVPGQGEEGVGTGGMGTLNNSASSQPMTTHSNPKMINAGIEAMLHFTRIRTIRQNATSMSRMVTRFEPLVIRCPLRCRGPFD